MSSSYRHLLFVVGAIGCGGPAKPAPVKAGPSMSRSTPAPTRPAGSAQTPPGEIAGRWRVGCAENQGEIVEFTVTGDKAVGRVVDPGSAARFGFKKGEEVFRLTVDPSGQWAGTTHWRGISGSEHWDGIVFSVTPSVLSATVTNEACYRSIERVR